MAQHHIPARFLLAQDDNVPSIANWEIRFENSFVDLDSDGWLFYGKHCFRVHTEQDNKLQIERETREAEAALRQQNFFSAWNAAAERLPDFPHLKTRLHLLAPDDYELNTWYADEAVLAEVRDSGLPAYLLNLAQVEENYRRFIDLLPDYRVYYSIKTNPDPKVLRVLQQAGAGFEAVSFAEVELAFAAGARANEIIFSAPVKRVEDIRQAFAAGIRIFVADCQVEINKLAEHAPGCRLLLRLKTSDQGARVKLSSKYGLDAGQIPALFQRAQNLGLQPYGLSFHVGGQNILHNAWLDMQHIAHRLFAEMATAGITLRLVNIGGGFPIKLDKCVPDLTEIATTLEDSHQPGLSYCAEPGRIIVGDAAKLACPVICVAERSDGIWLYIDASIFGSLFMMGIHAFEYPISTDHCALDVQPYHIASLSCDGRDIISRNTLLPVGISVGHLLFFHMVGGYSLPVFDVAYAGVSPTPTYYIS